MSYLTFHHSLSELDQKVSAIMGTEEKMYSLNEATVMSVVERVIEHPDVTVKLSLSLGNGTFGFNFYMDGEKYKIRNPRQACEFLIMLDEMDEHI